MFAVGFILLQQDLLLFWLRESTEHTDISSYLAFFFLAIPFISKHRYPQSEYSWNYLPLYHQPYPKHLPLMLKKLWAFQYGLSPAYVSFRKSLVQETNSSVTCDQFIPWFMPESWIIINVFLAAFFNERNRYRDFKSLLSITCLWILLSFIISRKSGWQKQSIRECNHKTPLP